MSGFVPLGARQEDEESQEAQPTRAKVVGLLNEAQLSGMALNCLHKVKELILKKDPSLLDSFLEEVIAFQGDQSADVRKFVVAFMEDACKADSGMLVRVIPMLSYMMDDNSVNVIKRLLVCIVQLYKIALIHVSKLRAIEDEVQDMWESLQELKLRVCDLSESENDGVRTMAIKFMEVLILCQTKKDPPTRSQELDVSLDIVSMDHPLLNLAELREEAGTTVGTLLSLVSSPSISSVNLMTAVGCLANIAKQRSKYINTVLQSFEHLHANLPPHFATSQITSVRKQLKTQLLSLLKLQSSFECRGQLTTLLTDLGCTQAEITKIAPKMSSERLKRARASSVKTVDDVPSAKRQRLSTRGQERGGVEPLSISPAAPDKGTALMEAIDMTAADLRPLLSPEAVTELVMTNMKSLPFRLPKSFLSSFTPIAAAGTNAQVTHLARLLASQMTSAGLGIGAEAKGIKPQQRQHSRSPSPLRSSGPRDPRKHRGEEGEGQRKRRKTRESVEGDKSVDEDKKPDFETSMAELKYLGNLLGMPNVTDPMFPLAYTAFFGMDANRPLGLDPLSNLVTIPSKPKAEVVAKQPVKKEKRKSTTVAPQKLKRIRMFDLSTVVKPLSLSLNKEMSIATFKRILEAENVPTHGAASQARIKLIISLVSQFGQEFNTTLLEFILDDLRTNMDLAIAWLFTEYSISEGYVSSAQNNFQYDVCFTGLLLGAKEKLGPKDRLFTRLVLEAPKITKNALDIIKSYCRDEERAFLGVSTLKELVMKRPQGPGGANDFLEALLEVTNSDIELVRAQTLHFVKKLYSKPELSMKIERYALHQLQFLLSDHPTFLEENNLDDIGYAATDWSEDTVRICMNLFLSLLPLNHKLLKDLAIVYTSTTATVKKIIHSHLDQPLSLIGMDSPELLQLVEKCPPGGETLIMRMLHILTDCSPPSAELVQRVRELYQRNSSDVRFLIPVLHGLKKQEVIAALPKFIKLSPGLVKNIFERLLVSFKGDQGHSISPISPSELLIALHNIDCSSDDTLMKATVKATNFCFQEKSVYTQEVLAVVLQQLLEQTPIPTLFMRTVLQSLGICPKLINFVITILAKLISKQVWKQPKVWQGFVKCCEVTKPLSFQVMLQLPQHQLENVLEMSPGLRDPMVSYVQNLTPHQRAVIPKTLLVIVEQACTEEDVGKISAKKSKVRRESTTKQKQPVKEINTDQNLDESSTSV
ncbi:symplekin-like isoform X2 [Halichondria panicea]|uniref:symplekin-like isoform X2 n=1 Tax=Halichondria panicea TaxID=6063 RepID=UPI00312BB393